MSGFAEYSILLKKCLNKKFLEWVNSYLYLKDLYSKNLVNNKKKTPRKKGTNQTEISTAEDSNKVVINN